MKNIFSLLLAVLILTSCSLTQQYSFNEDFSGIYQLQFDITEMATYGVEDPDSIPNVFEDFNLDSVKLAYENIDGLSKVNVSEENNVLTVRYNFANLDALNASLDIQNQGDLSLNSSSETKFSFENGVFSYRFGDDGEAAATDSLAEVMAFIDYDIIMDFAKPIDAASNGIVSENRKRLSFNGNLSEVATKEKSLNVEVTFKK